MQPAPANLPSLWILALLRTWGEHFEPFVAPGMVCREILQRGFATW
jgi:hypothetical protein